MERFVIILGGILKFYHGSFVLGANEQKRIIYFTKGGILNIVDNTGSVANISATWANLSVIGEYTRHVGINGDDSKAEAGAMRIDVIKAPNDGTINVKEKQGGERTISWVFIGQ